MSELASVRTRFSSSRDTTSSYSGFATTPISSGNQMYFVPSGSGCSRSTSGCCCTRPRNVSLGSDSRSDRMWKPLTLTCRFAAMRWSRFTRTSLRL
jgi:hypothetical protein